MFVLVRAVTWSALFIGLLLIYLPGALLSRSGVSRPEMGALQIAGTLVAACGAALAAWCI